MHVLPGGCRLALVFAAATALLSVDVPFAHARDLFSSLFDALSGRPASLPQARLEYQDSGDMRFPPPPPTPQATAESGRSMAFCVRTCDGRYFPLSASNGQTRAATCNSLCPAADTKVFYGSTIEHATTESGKVYASLPNAFRYRERLVDGCTCNGKDPVGLAAISIEDDKTIRKGDIVAGENGLIVATRGADMKRGRVADFSPAPARIREKFERPQALARN